MQHHVSINIEPVLGGFIVSYPKFVDAEVGAGQDLIHVQEVATSVAKAMRIVKAAVDAFSKVDKQD